MDFSLLVPLSGVKYLPGIKKNDIRNPTKSNERRGIASADSDGFRCWVLGFPFPEN
jgi:hypothetical protein